MCVVCTRAFVYMCVHISAVYTYIYIYMHTYICVWCVYMHLYIRVHISVIYMRVCCAYDYVVFVLSRTLNILMLLVCTRTLVKYTRFTVFYINHNLNFECTHVFGFCHVHQNPS